MFLVQAGPGQQPGHPWATWGVPSIHFHLSNIKVPCYLTVLPEGPAGLQALCRAADAFLMPSNSWAMLGFWWRKETSSARFQNEKCISQYKQFYLLMHFKMLQAKLKEKKRLHQVRTLCLPYSNFHSLIVMRKPSCALKKPQKVLLFSTIFSSGDFLSLLLFSSEWISKGSALQILVQSALEFK